MSDPPAKTGAPADDADAKTREGVTDEPAKMVVLWPIAERISKAKDEVSVAEKELDVALRAVEKLPRAQKTRVSPLVQEAFVKLKAMRIDLAALEEKLKELPLEADDD